MPTFTDFECILVDDCSTDKSADICDEYAQNDKRINVIHNKINQGSSLARKTGLKAAAGAYIQFVDSDDWIEEDMLESLYTAATSKNCDVVWQDYFGFDDAYCGQIISNYDKLAIIKRILDNENGAAAVIWAKFIAKHIFFSVEFPEAMQWEDLVLTAQIIALSKNMAHLQKAFYHHRRNPASLSENIARKEKGIAEVISNLSLTIEHCRNYFGNDFYKLEPELSACVNRFKYESLFVKNLRHNGILKNFYRQSNDNIFDKENTAKYYKKIILYAAVKNTFFIYLFIDILKLMRNLRDKKRYAALMKNPRIPHGKNNENKPAQNSFN